MQAVTARVKIKVWDFPDGLVVKALCLYSRVGGSIPGRHILGGAVCQGVGGERITEMSRFPAAWLSPGHTGRQVRIVNKVK